MNAMTNKFFTIINPVRRVLICLLLLFMDPIVRAKSFLGLEPLEPLSSVKQRFSAGALTVEPADWLKPNQYFVKMQHPDGGGKVFLLFEHDDEMRKKKLVDLEKSVANLPSQAQGRSTKLLIRQYREKLSKPIDERLSLIRIRWLPDNPTRVNELITSYGKPDEKREGNAVYGPVFIWSKGLNAHLSDDKKQALMIEYWFTEDDLAVYFLRRDSAAR
jgi:HAMP domain-containing protein